jgi:cobalt-zinc-cadmium efflux system outer membrane protein
VEAADTLAVVPVPEDFDRLERVAMERRPELFSVNKQIAAADAQRSLAQQYLLPDLQLSVNWNFPYGPAGGVPTNYTTGLSVAFPLFFWNHQRGEVAEAKHHQLELTATQKDVIAQVGQDLRNAYATAVTSYRQAVFIRDQLLPSAEEQYQIASRTYALGGSSALEVIDSQNTLLDARNQFATALGALNDAVADLERAVGAPLDTTPTGTTHD